MKKLFLFLIITLLAFLLAISFDACNRNKKESVTIADDILKADSTNPIDGVYHVDYSSGRLFIPKEGEQTRTVAQYNDSTGVIKVFNKRGEILWQGNTNDTIKIAHKACKNKHKACKNKHKYKTYSEYRKENRMLKILFDSCKKTSIKISDTLK